MTLTRRSLVAATAALPFAARAQARPTIKIGVMNDMSGPYRDATGMGVRRVRAAGGAAVQQRRVRRAGAGRGSPEQAGRRRRRRPRLVRPGRRGRDHGRADLLRGAGGELHREGEEQALHQHRRRHG